MFLHGCFAIYIAGWYLAVRKYAYDSECVHACEASCVCVCWLSGNVNGCLHFTPAKHVMQFRVIRMNYAGCLPFRIRNSKNHEAGDSSE